MVEPTVSNSTDLRDGGTGNFPLRLSQQHCNLRSIVRFGTCGSVAATFPTQARYGLMVRNTQRCGDDSRTGSFSGQILHPWEFAEQNYAQFPAFHLPYHPPGYPALLGLFFTVTGVSYGSGKDLHRPLFVGGRMLLLRHFEKNGVITGSGFLQRRCC